MFINFMNINFRLCGLCVSIIILRCKVLMLRHQFIRAERSNNIGNMLKAYRKLIDYSIEARQLNCAVKMYMIGLHQLLGK